MEAFAKGEGFPLARREKGHTHNDSIAEVTRRRAERGLSTPTEVPPKADRPDYLHPAEKTAAKPGERRNQRRSGWTEDECIEGVIQFLNWLDENPTAKSDSRTYDAFAAGHGELPGASAFDRHGGYNRIYAKASRIRRERLRNGRRKV